MANYAKVENRIVTQVIVADQTIIDSGLFEGVWIQTSYNTKANVHYDPDGKPDGGIALRGNFAGIDYTYNEQYDVFYAPQPYPSWILNHNTWTWDASIPYPNDGKDYIWDENSLSWVITNDYL
jgi:hypothetical protein